MFNFFKILENLKNYFFVSQAPIGLTAMGLKSNYLEKVNNFNYDNISFCLDILYPVQKPYFFETN